MSKASHPRKRRVSSHRAAARPRVRETTIGDLISAACDAGGSTDAAVALLSPRSPLYRLLGRRIVLAA